MSVNKEVWVWAEVRGGRVLDVSLELLGKARELGDKLESTVSSILIGDRVEDLAPELIYHGADKVYILKDSQLHPYECNLHASLLAELAKKYEPQILLIGATSIGREISSSVAARLKTGLTAHCVDLYLDNEWRLVQVVPWLEEYMMMEMVCDRYPQMATAKPGVFAKPEADTARTGSVERVISEGKQEETAVRVIAVAEESPPEIALESANRVVAGGWGLHSVGGFEPVKELANILGAVIGGTRPAVDEGWVPEDSMIGQSGKTVRPELFVSIGASGAMHYTTGFSRAKVVMAIDQNPRAPIFEMADVGIVGDLAEILPCLIEEFRRACKAG